MRGEALQGILALPDDAQVDTHAVEVIHVAEFALPDQVFDVAEGGVVEQQMAHHQPPVVFVGQGHEALGLGQGLRHRLFDKHMFACLQGSLGHRKMLRRFSGDDDGLDVGVFEQVFVPARGGQAGMLAGQALEHVSPLVAGQHNVDTGQPREITQQVLAPVSNAYLGDTDGSFSHLFTAESAEDTEGQESCLRHGGCRL